MNSLLLAALVLLSQPANPLARPASPETRLYELRTYFASPGKLDNLQARFRDHTMKLFEKHGIKNVGYWIPIDNKENKLIYMVSFPSRESREASFKEFGADPEWQKVYKDSEANGKLVEKIDSLLLTPTDYSPAMKDIKNPIDPRAFELRTYHAAAGKLSDLHSRFRDHTAKLFDKHGITNFGYWTPVEKSRGAEDTLVYLVIHKSKEDAAKSWGEFGKDPDWISARNDSEKNGKLVDKVESVYMRATDFSPVK